MVKLCIACTVSYFFLSLHNRKCGAEDLLMYAYRIVFPSIFEKGGEVGLRGLYKECTSLSPLSYHTVASLCIVMFNLGVVRDRIVGVPGLYFLITSSHGTVCIIL